MNLARAIRWVTGLVCALAALLAAATVSAVDVWTEPNPGIRHLHRTTPAPAEFHALVIDLDAPGVRIRCTPLRERWKSTSAYARDANLAAAINGGFWGLFGQGAQGLAAGAGQIWASDDEEHGFFAVGADGRAWISRPSDVVEAGRRRVTDAVSGRPLIIDRGRLADELYTFPRTYTREPRSAVAVSENGRRVILVTVDGRRATSHGGTLTEVGELMIELGGYRGINLDGGGSTTMYIASEGGVVNRPSRGWEREVVNHIGVVAPPPTAPAAAQVTATPSAVVAEAREAHAHGSGSDASGGGNLRGRLGRWMVLDRLHLGRRREVAVPLFWGAATLTALSGVLMAVAWARRLRTARGAKPPTAVRPEPATPRRSNA